jgi:rhodanese-related sulfurtransferase
MNLLPFLLHNWALLLIAVVAGTLLMAPGLMSGMRPGGLSAGDAVHLMNRERAVVVDVSENTEFAAGHIVGARNIPVAQFDQRLPEVVKNKGVPLILVCATGARAQRCLAKAKTLGYEKAVVLAGGLRSWKDANLPVERS